MRSAPGRAGRWSPLTPSCFRLPASEDTRRRHGQEQGGLPGHWRALLEAQEGVPGIFSRTAARTTTSRSAVADRLKDFPEAIGTVFPEALVQTCIVHLICYSIQFASWKKRRAITVALKPVYGTESAAAAANRLEEFDAAPWGAKYPAIAQSWRRNWEKVIPFFAFPGSVRRIIVTQSTAPDQCIPGQRGR